MSAEKRRADWVQRTESCGTSMKSRKWGEEVRDACRNKGIGRRRTRNDAVTKGSTEICLSGLPFKW